MLTHSKDDVVMMLIISFEKYFKYDLKCCTCYKSVYKMYGFQRSGFSHIPSTTYSYYGAQLQQGAEELLDDRKRRFTNLFPPFLGCIICMLNHNQHPHILPNEGILQSGCGVTNRFSELKSCCSNWVQEVLLLFSLKHNPQFTVKRK